MLKRLLVMSAIVLSGWLGGAALLAQEPSTIVLKSGERISADLVDMNGSGFAVRVNGQDRTIGTGDVAWIEFVGGTASGDVQNRVNAGQQVVVLRSGQVLEGRLSDVGGTRPLRLTVDTPSGQREFTSNDVAQVYFANAAAQAVGTSGQAVAAPVPAGAQTITVQANQPWTDTGITVQRGERIQFNASGDIMVSAQASSGVGGSPIQPGGRLPFAGAGVGALIARVGNGAPFLIATNTTPIPMPANGRLQLGINDDHHADNTGQFTVAVTRLGR
jgi:hypothetical protein